MQQSYMVYNHTISSHWLLMPLGQTHRHKQTYQSRDGINGGMVEMAETVGF